MGFMIKWDTAKIISDLRQCAAQVKSPYNDGYSAWHCKQDLLQVKYLLDELLKDLPKFSGEEQYITELEKKQIWRAITKK